MLLCIDTVLLLAISVPFYVNQLIQIATELTSHHEREVSCFILRNIEEMGYGAKYSGS